ncbi:MAG TPA: isopeptide-forming domain-containing fimbrial protein, partial [Solirubrobacterales bacterium]
MATVRNTLVLAVACVLAALGLIAPATAAAEGTPNISLDKNAPETALLGTNQKVQLVASNPAGQKRGYNLTFRDVLPKGVEYVPGSAKVAPQVLENEPGTGMTTLIFENVADLSGNSKYALSYEVKPSTSFFKFTGEHVYTNKAEAFAGEQPRKKPRFNAKGEVEVGSFTGKDVAEATTELTAIEIEKSEPSPEGEILRGVHEHQTVYTLKVRNNKVGPTQGVAGVGPAGKPAIVIEDWLPAGLEFLGCGNVDNTTDAAATNPGSAEEYPGSGAIDPGNAPAAPRCVEPFFVETEKVVPPGGKQPEGVYTHVKFLGPESLATGEEIELQYVAAIPIRQNSLEWKGPAGKPTAASLGQIANLDNNNGPETFDEEQLTNVAQAHGNYEAVPVQDTDEMTRTAEDLAIQKSVNEPKISDGAESLWSLRLEASEYRRIEPVSITDQLPNGLCPRGPKDYEGPTGGPITEPKAECEPSVILHPTVKYLKGGPTGKVGTEEQIEFSLAEEEAEGGFRLEFNAPDVEALKRLEPSQELLITFPTTTRTFYQHEFKDNGAKPVLTGDSWTNDVATEGTGFSRCTVEPNCEGPGAEPIVKEPVTGTHVTDVSSASQEAGDVEIEKAVRENNGPIPTHCKEAPGSEYVKGIVSPTEPSLPRYRPGDEICWRLVVKFASNLYAGAPVVSDFIPPGEEYVPNSQEAGTANTVEANFNEAAAIAEEALEWTLGSPGSGSVEKGLRFEYLFKTKVTASAEVDPGEITGNLMKFLYSNTAGETFPLRDRAEVERHEPELSLEKGITRVGGKEVIGAPKSSVIAGGGELVEYELDVENAGNLAAEEAEVWDVLPKGIECAAVTLPTQTAPQAAACVEGIIKWTGVAIPVGARTALTYEAMVPSNVAPGHPFINHAGVARYKSQTNTPAGKFEYIPAENINKELTKPNTGPLLAQAEVKTTAAALQKEATTETQQPGDNASQATIGEIVDYTVTAKIPPNSKIYGTPVVKDVLPANLALVPGSIEAKLDGNALTFEGVTLVPLANGAEVHFNGPYPATPGPEHTLVLKLKGMVRDIAANHSGVTITNGASFEFKDVEEGATTVLNKTVDTPVVEPHLELFKRLLPEGRSTTVAPGEIVEYETEVKNLEGASTANEVSIVDTVPSGMEIADKGTGTELSPTTLGWTFEELAPNTAQHLVYKLKVKEPATAAASFNNLVVGKTQSLPAGLSTETREASFKEGTYEAAKEGYEGNAENAVRLIGATVSKEVTPGEGTIGSELTYTLHMNLPGEIKFFNTTMVDQLPKGLTFDELLGTECKGERCNVGTELAPEAGPEGSTLRGWYFGNFEPGPPRELIVKFNAYVNPEATEGELTNALAGFYNESDKGEPTELPVPGSKSPLFNEETAVANAGAKVLEPKLELKKAVSGGVNGKALPGGALEYTLTVKNSGTWDAYDFNVEDNPSANLTGFELGAVEGGTATVVSTDPPAWHIEGPLARNGGEMKFHYKAMLVESKDLESGEKVENHAEVPTYFGLPPAERKPGQFREYGPLEAEQELEVELPQIAVEKSVGVPGQKNADVGVGFPWLILAKNTAANAGAENAVVTDELPEGWTYVVGSATVGGTQVEPGFTPGNPRKLTWVVASLPAGGAPAEIRFEATPEVGTTEGLNRATAKAEDKSGGKESKNGPYEDSDTAAALVVAPKFKVEKTPDGATAVAGTEATYTIKVTNVGTGKAAAPISVKDQLGPEQEFSGPGTLPAGVSFVSVNPPSDLAGQAIEWTIASLEVGESVEIPVPVKVPSEDDVGSTIKDTAEVSSPQAPTPVKDEGSFLIERETDLAIEKKADRENVNGGEDIDYTLTAKNLGPSDATGVTVTDEIPAGTTFVKAATKAGGLGSCTFTAPTVTCVVPVMVAHAEAEFEVEVEIESGRLTPILNIAEITGIEHDPNLVNNKAEVTTPIGGSADLSILKTGPSRPVLLGSTFTYKLEVENTGPSNATEVEVQDKLPEEVEFLEATAPAGTTCTETGGTLTCELGTLLPKSPIVLIEVTVKAIALPASGEKAVNTAEVESPTPDPETENNHSTVETEIVPAADLALTKTAPATVEPDGTLTYALHVENHGPSDAHKVRVSDPLPAGVDFVSASEGCAATTSIVTCEVPGGELEVGKAADFQITVHVPFALVGQPLVNTATVAAEE